MSGETDPAEFFKPSRGTWNPKKFANRTPLSVIVDRDVRLVRAPKGSSHWIQGLLHVVDGATGEVLATVHPSGFRDPSTGWGLRPDC